MDGPTEADRIRPPGVSDRQSIAIDALSQVLDPDADYRHLRLVEPEEQQGA